MLRVPVLSDEGIPLMPAKASRVRRWLKNEEAIVVFNKLGIFQVQLIRPNKNWGTGEKFQTISVGINPGKRYSRVRVQSAKEKAT